MKENARMEEKYTVFDVETPNGANDRICSIGISEIENGMIIESQNIFVNPECEFDSFNIHIHGISERDVIDAETFLYIWPKLRPLFLDRVIIAHNAPFDLSVLRKTLAAYGIEEKEIHYLDTVKAARCIYPELPNYKLNTLCNYLGFELEHHNSGSDCRATAELFLDMCSKGLNVKEFIRPYSLNECDCKADVKVRKRTCSSETRALLELKTILATITGDDKIEPSRLLELHNWIEEHAEMSETYPCNMISHRIGSILENGIIGNDEYGKLLEACDKVLDPVGTNCSCSGSVIEVKGKNVVLSGEFSIGSKSKVESILIERGAKIQKSVTSKTNILLVGDEGSSAWIAGNYGTKVKKAMSLQEKGIPVTILRESDYFIK